MIFVLAGILFHDQNTYWMHMMTQPAMSGQVFAIRTSMGSLSSDNVCGMKPQSE
ncbi:hypothetical protein RLEG3_02735 (plasmid) [Rhizobium leguminosarum bv. trifolii WSM1689]|nr:hypothetical protein RLEG3_02735 [Rhizobium leguminosarum bv. trifolii WSM1689]